MASWGEDPSIMMLLFSESKPVRVKKICSEEQLLDILECTDFKPNLGKFFQKMSSAPDETVIPLNFAGLVLRHFRSRPDLWYRRLGGKGSFLQNLKFLPRVTLPRSIVETNPGPCLMRLYVLMKHLEIDPKGRLSVIVDQVGNHIDISETIPSKLRFKWGKGICIQGCPPVSQVQFPNPTYEDVSNLEFYYQGYQFLLDANRADCYSAIVLALNHLNIDVALSKTNGRIELVRGCSCRNRQWKFCEHMVSSYLQRKGFKYMKLHRYPCFVRKERDTFKLADQYLQELHRDYVVYTDIPSMKKVKMPGKIKIQKETEQETFEEVVDPRPSQPPERIAALWEMEKEEQAMFEQEGISECIYEIGAYSVAQLNSCKDIAEMPEGRRRMMLNAYEKTKNKNKADNNLYKSYAEAIGSGLQHEDLCQIYEEKLKGKRILAKIHRIRKALANKGIELGRDEVPKMIYYSDNLKKEIPPPEIKEGRLVRYKGTKKILKEVEWVDGEVEKMVTYKVVPLGGSLYRRIDLAPVAEAQKQSQKMTPFTRRRIENLKKARRLRKLLDNETGGDLDKDFFYKYLIGKDAKQMFLEYKKRLKLKDKKLVAKAQAYQEGLKSRFGSDWIERSLKEFVPTPEEPSKKTNSPVLDAPKDYIRGIKDFVRIPYKLRKKRWDGSREVKMKPVITPGFHGSYESARAKVNTKLEELKVPDHLQSLFWNYKFHVVMSKLSWTSDRFGMPYRSRSNFRAPKKLLYNKMFLPG